MVGRIPKEFIDDLLTRIDIVDVIESRVDLRKAGREFQARCPFHEEKTPSFTVSRDKQFYHCFGCGAHGSAISFLMEYERLDFVEALEELATKANLEIPRSESTSSSQQQGPDLYPIMAHADQFYQTQLRSHPQAERAVTYLKDRGLSGETAAAYGMGFAPPGWDNLLQALGKNDQAKQQLLAAGLTVEKERGRFYDRFRERIIFPIRDRRGRVIAFGGRALGDENPKYLNSPETALFHKGQELYGLYEALAGNRKLQQLVVVEGYMDVVMLAQHGITESVATLGTATSQEQVERLFRAAPEAIFCFDGDRAGRQAAWRALENTLPAMREGRTARFLFLPEGEDPDSTVRQEGEEVFRKRLASSAPLSDFMFSQLTAQVDMSSAEGRASLVELAKPLLSKLSTGVYQNLLRQRLSELAQVDMGGLAPHLGKRARSTPRKRAAQAAHSDRHHLTPVAKAIALLLQQPKLADGIDDPRRWEGAELPGVDLLIEILEAIKSQPDITGIALLERWRGAEAEKHLWRLFNRELITPPEGAEVEFKGLIQNLDQQGSDRRYRELSSRKPSELSPQERKEFQRLVAERR